MSFGSRPFPSRSDRPDKGGRSGPGGRARTADPVETARQICLNQLEHAPRTRAELAGRLRDKGVADDVAEQVLSRFAEVGMIDDALFAQMWVTSRHRGKGLARRALTQELRRKGVDEQSVAEALATLDPDQELVTARALVDRRLRTTTGLTPEARVRRLAGMLARKGYPAGVAFRVVKQALAAEGVEAELGFDELSGLDDEAAQ
ncbi:MAG: regulatory protein RecX [Frankiales bacterium]|nr:regulatory protein RecX [Frankiales bacterium]